MGAPASFPVSHLLYPSPHLLQPIPLHTASLSRTACPPSAIRRYRRLRRQGSPWSVRIQAGSMSPWQPRGDRGGARLEEDGENRPAIGPRRAAVKSAWRLVGGARDVTERRGDARGAYTCRAPLRCLRESRAERRDGGCCRSCFFSPPLRLPFWRPAPILPAPGLWPIPCTPCSCSRPLSLR